MFKSLRNNRMAFTLIEMSVVVAIIGLLYVTVVPMYGRTIQRSKETALKKDLHVFRTILSDYFKDHEKWPESLNSLVTQGYIRSIPPDPFTEKIDTWVVVPSQPGNNDVYDVKSGADGQSLDGINYADF
ncbi:MAG: type II secretion system protein G [Candidatus Riflebacteria bacterium HGW-Riflebacteria-1]|jgi:general secretion pathway protein G|nr:MAG: type II secretion system protein G [Candidatus Riflebacteria bacterium HGW-Riflebacteria-1]